MAIRIAIVLPVLVAGACAASPTGPSVPLGDAFELGVGESARISGTGFGVGFEGVLADSRCPTDVVCVVPGEAEVRVTVRGPGRRSMAYTLRTAGPGRRVVLPHYVLELTRLEPYPSSATPIPMESYRATLRVARGLPAP